MIFFNISIASIQLAALWRSGLSHLVGVLSQFATGIAFGGGTSQYNPLQ